LGETKRIGRPTKPAAPGTRVSLGLKVTGEIKKRLEDAALASGRTQSQEAEFRLENSFRDEAMAISVLELAFGHWLPQILQVLSETHTNGKTTVQ
jgi:hypothetical protein